MKDNPTPPARPASSAAPAISRPNIDATMQTLYASDPTVDEKRTK